jgi:hypothetical protein
VIDDKYNIVKRANPRLGNRHLSTWREGKKGFGDLKDLPRAK